MRTACVQEVEDVASLIQSGFKLALLSFLRSMLAAGLCREHPPACWGRLAECSQEAGAQVTQAEQAWGTRRDGRFLII